jgi:hypothetical protein
LAGESLREVGVLVLVFVPLDSIFYQGELKVAMVISLAILTLVGVVLVTAGILLEKE